MAAVVSNSHLPESPTSQQHDYRPRNHPASCHSKASSLVREQQQQSAPLFLGFNQDHSRFACGTHTGFRVYDCEPFKEAYSRESTNGGIGIIELLFRSNILAIIGGGPNPKYPPNKLMIWDNNEGRCIGELSFRSQVRAVKLRRDRIVAVLEHKVFVYNFADLKLLLQIETVANPRGLCALSSTTNSSVLACPGIQKGQVRVEHYDVKKTKFIAAHDSRLACLVLALDGLLLATASSKGTLIRVFNTVDGTLLQELRRGADRAEIYSIAFAANTHWLAVSSDKGTIHVFSLKAPTNGEEGKIANGAQSILATANQSNTGASSSSTAANTNPGSTLSFMKVVLPRYFSSEWSFSQFRLPEEMKSIVAFGPEKHTIAIVGSDGSFYKCSFDPVHGGEMVQRDYFKFIKPKDPVSS